jgi:GNAT superfamily N-acetyltransferase
LEDAVRDAFLEDAFDGRLHLLTIRDTSRTLKKIGHPIVALVFWRDLDRNEIHNWARDLEECHRGLLEDGPSPSQTPPPLNGTPKDDGDQLSLVVHSNNRLELNDSFDMSSLADVLSEETMDLALDPCNWIKIELLGTHPDHLRRGYARLLLVSVLLISLARDGKKSAVLQVAGGYEDNVAAMELYLSLGFARPPKEMFKKPCNNVLVLWSIQRTLEGLDWRWFGKVGRLRPADKVDDVDAGRE